MTWQSHEFSRLDTKTEKIEINHILTARFGGGSTTEVENLFKQTNVIKETPI